MLKVKLPLSGRSRKRNPAAQISLKKISSAPPWVPPSPPHLQAQRAFTDKPGKPLTNAFSSYQPDPLTSPSQGTAPPRLKPETPAPPPPPLLQPPTLQAFCARSSPAALATPRPWSVLSLKFQTDLSLPCLKPSKGFLSWQGLPCPQPCWMLLACVPGLFSLAQAGHLGHPLPVRPPC